MPNLFRKCRTLVSALRFYLFNHFISFFPIYWVRSLYVRAVLRIKLSRKSSLHLSCFITGSSISIGENTVVNRRVHLDGRGTLLIGSNVSISPESYILSMTHDVQSSDFIGVCKQTKIEDFVWIGVRAIILPGVTIGKGAVVGAGAVVTHDVPPYHIVAGNPAKQIGIRSKELFYKPEYRPWFDTDIE